MAQAQGWTVVPEPAQAPAGWTPVAEPNFKGENEKTAAGTPAVDQYYGRSAGYRNLMNSLIEHLPLLTGAGGGIVGSVGGPAGSVGGAALGGAAGEAYRELINRARGKPAPLSATDAAKQIGTQAAIQGGAQAVGETATPLLTSLGERLMQSAVKPGVKVLVQAAKAGQSTPPVVKTLLDEGINVTPNGVAKLRTLIDATNDEITDAVASSAGRISPLRAASRLNETAAKFAAQVNPQADLEAISQVGQNFLEHPSMTSATLSVPEAQALKAGTYARIGGKYGTAGAASIEAEKAVARGLKEEIAAEVPGVADLNAHEGRLLQALDVLGKRVALQGNRDPIGFAWVAHNPTTFLAALMDRSPAVKSLIARGLYTYAGAVGKVAPQLIRVAVHSLTSEDAEGAVGSSTDPGGQPQR